MKTTVLNENSFRAFAGLYDLSALSYPDDSNIMIGVLDDEADIPIPVGLLTASVFLDEVSVQWLYVDEEYRRQGAASAMLDVLAGSCYALGIRNIHVTFTSKNRGMGLFLRKNGFDVFTNQGWHLFETKLRKFKECSGFLPQGYRLSSLVTMDRLFVDDMNSRLLKGDRKTGVRLPLDPRDYSPFSCCIYSGSGIEGLMPVKTYIEKGRQIIEIPWLYIEPSAEKCFPFMCGAVSGALKEYYGKNTLIRFSCTDIHIEQLYEKAVEEALPSEICMAALEFKD